MSQHNNTALFLDFDGVLCDSVAECFVSSWLAYFDREGSKMPESVSLAQKDLFTRYRPFIRRGADYMLLQYAIENNIELVAQRDFDNLERALGTGKA
jgi:beta-phosphoglucomutase-like phosphatase (HAD superfamily)